MGVVADVAAGYVAAGYFTVIDGILIPGFLEPVRESLRAAGCRVDLAILRAPCPPVSRGCAGAKASPSVCSAACK
jgi:hypothetical protein